MRKQTLGSLARFCASQRRAFDLRAWFAQRTIDRRDLAIAALYLSMTSWYGYEAKFDLARFSATTRYWIHQPALEQTPEA